MVALERAVRWGTTARPLYEAQLAIAQCAVGGAACRQLFCQLGERGLIELAELDHILERDECIFGLTA